MPASMTVSDCTERELIARLQALLPPAPAWMPVGIGDDAAVVEPERNRLEVLSVDSIVEGVHFDRAFVPADAIGHRALAVNLSDLAAMGAAPRLALLAMALPARLPLADFDAIAGGFCQLAARHRLHLAGGNLTRSPGPLMIDVTVVGTVKRRQALTRAGARPGDALYVSGTIGGAAAGLLALKSTTTEGTDTNGKHGLTECLSSKFDSVSSVKLKFDSVRSVVEPCIQQYLRPEPRLRLGIWLGRNRAASACIDLSDGLADGVHRIAESSGVGMTVDADALPIADGARAIFDARGADAIREAIAAGDDYELLFTVKRRMDRALAAGARHAGIPLTRIGVCTEGRNVAIRRAGTESPLPLTGYSHFGADATMVSCHE
jgi:thiamine-monophosphate kinase